MNYLFFDIECATCVGGGKLCEFGYVLTDSDFRVKGSDNFLINPDAEFDKYVITNMLHHTLKDYKSSPKFPVFYDKIMSLLTDKNTLIVGHTTKGDIEHIGDDCVRYGLPFYDLTYVDIVELYKLHSKKREATSLLKMYEEFGGKQSGKEHSALYDANMTAFVAKSLAVEAGLSFEELCSANPSATFRTVNYEQIVRRKKSVEQFIEQCAKKGVKIAGKKEKSALISYASTVLTTPNRKIKRLKNKIIAISDIFETTRYNEAMNLIRLIKHGGAKYTPSVKNCNMLVTYKAFLDDGEEVYCKKKEDALRAIEKGKKIELLTLKELLNILDITEKELDAPFKV